MSLSYKKFLGEWVCHIKIPWWIVEVFSIKNIWYVPKCHLSCTLVWIGAHCLALLFLDFSLGWQDIWPDTLLGFDSERFSGNLSRIRPGNLWNPRQRLSLLRHHYFECDTAAGFARPQWRLFGNNRWVRARKYKTIASENPPMRFNPAKVAGAALKTKNTNFGTIVK